MLDITADPARHVQAACPEIVSDGSSQESIKGVQHDAQKALLLHRGYKTPLWLEPFMHKAQCEVQMRDADPLHGVMAMRGSTRP